MLAIIHPCGRSKQGTSIKQAFDKSTVSEENALNEQPMTINLLI